MSLEEDYAALKAAYDLREKEREWVSVDERLPLVGCTAIVYTTRGETLCAHYFSSAGIWGYGNGVLPPVTHWMPLPDPPGGV